jgi:hypothetical protein
VQPGVDALEADAAAGDLAMAVEAMGSLDWTSELAVRTANVLPVGGEAVAAAPATADGGANHRKWPSLHHGYTEQASSFRRGGRRNMPGGGRSSAKGPAEGLLAVYARELARAWADDDEKSR